MLENVLETQLEKLEAAILGMAPGALVLFDVVAAFPSAEWEWSWQCLDAMGVPSRLLRRLRSTYDATTMTLLINGEVLNDIVMCLRRGIKQGCPASGALWALLFDPMVRRLVSELPPHRYVLTCFADDFATALGNAVLGLRLPIPVFLEMLPAAGLAVHEGKTKVLTYSSSSDFGLRRRLADIPMAESFTVARRGVYLGILVGRGCVGREFDAALMKYEARCEHVRSVPGFVVERLRAHQVFVVSVLLFLAQIAQMPSRASVIEGAV